MTELLAFEVRDDIVGLIDLRPIRMTAIGCTKIHGVKVADIDG